jgi:hypothetical protein
LGNFFSTPSASDLEPSSPSYENGIFSLVYEQEEIIGCVFIKDMDWDTYWDKAKEKIK